MYLVWLLSSRTYSLTIQYNTMPLSSKKRKACLAASAAAKTKRVQGLIAQSTNNISATDIPAMPILQASIPAIREVLKERGLWRDRMLLGCCGSCEENIRCCVRRTLAMEEDFLHQKSHLIEARGHLVLFYPRFHCELNPIEFFWATAKRYTRNKLCIYTTSMDYVLQFRKL